MNMMTTLILIGVLAMIVAGAGFAFVQPRRFTDDDADGAPDGAKTAEANDAWNNPANAIDIEEELHGSHGHSSVRDVNRSEK